MAAPGDRVSDEELQSSPLWTVEAARAVGGPSRSFQPSGGARAGLCSLTSPLPQCGIVLLSQGVLQPTEAGSWEQKHAEHSSACALGRVGSRISSKETEGSGDLSSARTVVPGSEGMVDREWHLQQELVPLSRVLPIPRMRKSRLSHCSRRREEVALASLGPDLWLKHVALWPVEKGTS